MDHIGHIRGLPQFVKYSIMIDVCTFINGKCSQTIILEPNSNFQLPRIRFKTITIDTALSRIGCGCQTCTAVRALKWLRGFTARTTEYIQFA